jgi:mono/diheme cytochrome c family protein
MRKFCGLLAVGCIGGILYAAEAQGLVGQALRGLGIFQKHCVICHGADAKGTGQLAATLPRKPADLTDCRLTAEDPVEVVQGVIRHGGPYVGLSSVMPAWQGTLSEAEIADVAAYVKTLCTDPDWVPGDLNLPRPLITGKAFPEQEVIVGGQFGRNNRKVTQIFGTVEYRLDGLTNLEVKVPWLSINPDSGSTESGLGDIALSVKRVVAYSIEHRALASLGLELGLPTGSKSRGLSSGEYVWEPNLRAGWDWNQVVIQAVSRLVLPQDSTQDNAKVRSDIALGRYFQPDPRMFITPMVEFNTESRIAGPSKGETRSNVLPEVRLQWLRWSLGAGVQLPVSRLKDFDYRPLFDLTYEYLF